MKDKAYLIWFYAALLFIGGIIGFLQAGSFASLIMGALFCGFLTRYGYAVWQNDPFGYKMVIGNLIFLACFFGYRFLTTHKIMPSGFMTVVTLLVLAYVVLKKSNPKKVEKF